MRCRPSSLLGITDPLVAYYTDRAAWTFANVIEQEQEAAVARLPKTAKDKAHQRARQRVLDAFLGIEEAEQPERFRSPGVSR
jgi:hypothetical protein